MAGKDEPYSNEPRGMCFGLVELIMLRVCIFPTTKTELVYNLCLGVIVTDMMMIAALGQFLYYLLFKFSSIHTCKVIGAITSAAAEPKCSGDPGFLQPFEVTNQLISLRGGLYQSRIRSLSSFPPIAYNTVHHTTSPRIRLPSVLYL